MGKHTNSSVAYELNCKCKASLDVIEEYGWKTEEGLPKTICMLRSKSTACIRLQRYRSLAFGATDIKPNFYIV